TFPGDQVQPTIASDDGFGAIVAWTDGRAAGSKYIFAQHVLNTGALDPVWPINGRGVSNGSPAEGHPLAISDAEGGAIVTWEMQDVHLHILAQRITFNGGGDSGWPAGGLELGAHTQSRALVSIVPDGQGGAIAAWGGAIFAQDDSETVVAQHVSGSGIL